jgi:hypothetical protein
MTISELLSTAQTELDGGGGEVGRSGPRLEAVSTVLHTPAQPHKRAVCARARQPWCSR